MDGTRGWHVSGSGSAGDEGPLLDALADLSADAAVLTTLVADDAVWRSQDRDVLAAVGRLARVRAELEAAHLRLVRQVDTRGVAEASPVATSPEGFLRTACLMGATQARKDVAAARATAPGAVLEPFARLLQDGRCTREHVDVGVRVLDRIPAAVLAQDGAGQQVVDYLVLAARDASPVDLERAGRALLQTIAPDPDDRVDRESVQRRFLDLATDATGMLVGRLQLDPVAGAALRAAVLRWSGPESGADGDPDARQPRQRRADALSFLVETALAVEQPRRGERPRVVVHCTPEQLLAARDRPDGSAVGTARTEDGEPVPTWAARRLACDAVLQRVVLSPSDGPLDVGRTQRLATLTQRRALAARDGGCVVHGCGASPDICDAHHVRHWADGGPTDLGNLVLLCPGHHTAVHAGTWAVAIDDHQQVTVTPPRWVDPVQQPRPAWRQRAARFRYGSSGGAEGPDEGVRSRPIGPGRPGYPGPEPDVVHRGRAAPDGVVPDGVPLDDVLLEPVGRQGAVEPPDRDDPGGATAPAGRGRPEPPPADDDVWDWSIPVGASDFRVVRSERQTAPT